MSTFVFDCPSCSAQNSTFDVTGASTKPIAPQFAYWALLSTCRACKQSCCIETHLISTTFDHIKINYVSMETRIKAVRSILNSENDLSDNFKNFVYKPILPNSEQPPEYLPTEVEEKFKEAAKCLAIGCYNSAGAMFRLCLDITTKQILDNNAHKNPTANDKKSIHTRLKWIFDNGILPSDLEDLSRGIKDDGNDAAHDGSLSKVDAEDLLDFTYILLERVYTEPARVQNAAQRRVTRRQA